MTKLVTASASKKRDGFGADAFGRELKRLREGRGWSLNRMSQESGVSVTAVRKVEAGSANPSFLTALRLSDALGCSLNEIVQGARKALPELLFTKGTLQRGASGVVALHDQDDSILGPKLLTLAAREELDDHDLGSPMFAYVLEGSVAVTLANGHTERLQNHDALHVSESSVIKITNLLSRRARLLCLTDSRGVNPERAHS